MSTTVSPDWAAQLELDPNAVTPLYHQLKERIRAEAARLEPGAAIPPEKELMRLAAVGRATVRKAISDLVQEDVLYTHQGRGTFTAPRRIETTLERPLGFSETMLRLGRTPASRVLSAEKVPSTEDVASQLSLRPGIDVYVIERVRLVDGEPSMVERTHLPAELAPDLLVQDLTGSLYELLAKYGLRPASGTETIVAVNADRRLASLLDVPIASALLATVRLTSTSSGQPLEYTIRHARGDVLSFRISLNADSALAALSPAEQVLGASDGFIR